MAEHLGLTPSTASKTIDYLVQRHLMTRENDTQDRRRTHLRLTADGAATLAIIRESALRLIIRHLTQLTDGERRQIGASLELLLTAFQSAPEYLADAVTRETASTEAAVDRKALASPQHPE